LAKIGLLNWADELERLVQLYKADSPRFAVALTSIELWGGSGALWETNIRYDAGATAAQVRTFREALIKIARYINHCQIGSEALRRRVAFIASTFEEWNAKGL
jgi:hypothetical protein